MKENTLYACPVSGNPFGCILNRKAILNGHLPKGRLKKKKVEKRQEGGGDGEEEGRNCEKEEIESSVLNI